MQQTETTIIEVLGPGCANCKSLEARTTEAVAALGIDASIVKVTDPGEIVSYGVMSTPALVVDGHVLVSGRVPSVAEVRDLISNLDS